MSERILYGSRPRYGKTILFEEKRKKEFEKIRKEVLKVTKTSLKEKDDANGTLDMLRHNPHLSKPWKKVDKNCHGRG